VLELVSVAVVVVNNISQVMVVGETVDVYDDDDNWQRQEWRQKGG
jgi:hypothetical protein